MELESGLKKDGQMKRARFTEEQIIAVLKEHEAGTKTADLARKHGISEATIYNWLRQDRIDRGEIPGTSTDMALDLAAAKRRIRQLETELAVSRKVNEVFLEQGIAPKGRSR